MSEMPHTGEIGGHCTADTSRQPHGHYESYTLDIRPLALFGVGLATLVVVSFLLMGWLFAYLSEHRARQEVPPMRLMAEPQPPLEPRLQVAPHADFLKLRAAEDAVLHSYAWVNRDAGIVRIPIERALALLAERGLPARSEATAP